jgi:hypothetical protein
VDAGGRSVDAENTGRRHVGKRKRCLSREKAEALWRTRTADPLLTIANSGTVLACFRRFRVETICDRLPPVATTGLHKGSILSCQRRRQQPA